MKVVRSGIRNAVENSSRGFDDPISFIYQEHERQCEVCDLLEAVVSALHQSPDTAKLERIREFLGEDLPLHIEDEEIDLFPALARRCKDNQLVSCILDQLQDEHDVDRELVRPILEEITGIIETGVARDPNRFARSVRAFVETQYRHLTWENRVVLPLANRELSDDEKREIGRGMAARRGLVDRI